MPIDHIVLTLTRGKHTYSSVMESEADAQALKPFLADDVQASVTIERPLQLLAKPRRERKPKSAASPESKPKTNKDGTPRRKPGRKPKQAQNGTPAAGEPEAAA